MLVINDSHTGYLHQNTLVSKIPGSSYGTRGTCLKKKTEKLLFSIRKSHKKNKREKREMNRSYQNWVIVVGWGVIWRKRRCEGAITPTVPLREMTLLLLLLHILFLSRFISNYHRFNETDIFINLISEKRFSQRFEYSEKWLFGEL